MPCTAVAHRTQLPLLALHMSLPQQQRQQQQQQHVAPLAFLCTLHAMLLKQPCIIFDSEACTMILFIDQGVYLVLPGLSCEVGLQVDKFCPVKLPCCSSDVACHLSFHLGHRMYLCYKIRINFAY
uniref:Uncharacterized protein n=1 Tax=Dunaliella tertiolecta TaxID=3047 RepID=A0A7S3R5Z5_DUNTE